MVTPGPSAAAELASPSRELPSPASELPPPTPAGPSPCEDARPAPTPRPPDDPQVTGLLTAPGTVGTPGVLGSSTLDGTGSDSPFLPFAAGRVVEISPDVIVTIELGDDSPIDAWAAGLADARDRSGTTLIGLGGRGGGAQPLDSVHLQPLPVGCWVLLVSLHRADGRGSGATYWSISVTP